MQKKVIVIGGGFAGLTAASYLSKNKFKVTLIEASPKLGGRAYSFLDKDTNSIIDNGQHILMGCYNETIKFLSLIGAEKNFYFQKRLEVNFVKEGFDLLPLKSLPIFYPFGLIFGLLNYKAITIFQRVKLLKVFFKLPFLSPDKFSSMNIKQWLESEKQSEEIQTGFWKIIAVGALNTGIERGSAKIFIDILKQMFLAGNKSAVIVLPKSGLSQSFVNNAQDFILQNGGKINLSESVENILLQDGKIVQIQTSKQNICDFDYVISAIPAYAFKKVFNVENIVAMPEFNYSTIMNIHIWLKENTFAEGFFGLINSPLHWVFNKGTHLNTVISDADALANNSEDQLVKLVKDELRKFFLLDPEAISNYKIIKEKRATFIPSNNIIDKRPSQKNKIKNLILAGDWVDTGLPSTIESAVKSGRVASDLILSLN